MRNLANKSYMVRNNNNNSKEYLPPIRYMVTWEGNIWPPIMAHCPQWYWTFYRSDRLSISMSRRWVDHWKTMQGSTPPTSVWPLPTNHERFQGRPPTRTDASCTQAWLRAFIYGLPKTSFHMDIRSCYEKHSFSLEWLISSNGLTWNWWMQQHKQFMTFILN